MAMPGKLKIIFAGTPEFAAVTLQALLCSGHEICAVYTQPDRPAGRGRKLTPSPVKRLALEARIPLYQPATLKKPQVQDELRGLGADIMIVVAYGLLLPVQVLTIPRLGCVNIHASLLPRWRGAAPIQRAILAGDSQSGIAIMQMDEGLDTGDILSRACCDITADDTAASLHDRLAILGAETLMIALTQIESKTVTRIPQDEQLASYAAKIDKAEACMDWTQSAIMLERTVRAFNPWPVAYTTFNVNRRLRVWQAEVIKCKAGGSPGIVMNAGRPGIDVATGDGILRLRRIQLAGGRPMDATDFLNAHPVKKGDFLGQAGHDSKVSPGAGPGYSTSTT